MTPVAFLYFKMVIVMVMMMIRMRVMMMIRFLSEKATGDTDVCHLYFLEDDDDEYDHYDDDG